MNNLSILNNQVLTMSHYQIADVVGSRPDSVKRTMERLSERGVIELTPLVGVSHTMKSDWSGSFTHKKDLN